MGIGKIRNLGGGTSLKKVYIIKDGQWVWKSETMPPVNQYNGVTVTKESSDIKVIGNVTNAWNSACYMTKIPSNAGVVAKGYTEKVYGDFYNAFFVSANLGESSPDSVQCRMRFTSTTEQTISMRTTVGGYLYLYAYGAGQGEAWLNPFHIKELYYEVE